MLTLYRRIRSRLIFEIETACYDPQYSRLTRKASK